MKNFSQFLESISTIPESIDVNGKERSTRNSNGELIDKTLSGIERFWKWFDDSKIVDDDGRPLVVYHGTDHEFDDFDFRSNSVFFSAHKDISQGYGSKLRTAYIKMKNPYVFNWSTYKDENGVDWYLDGDTITTKRPEGFEENERTGDEIDVTYTGLIQDELIKRGFDGAVSDEGWGEGVRGFDEIAVFSPDQIRNI